MSAHSPSQLSPLDGSFLRLDTPQAHMHVGFHAVYSAPSDGAARPSIEALRERVARRLPGVPWCRWRLQDAPLGLSEPRWVEDPDFDLDAHVIGLTGPDTGVGQEAFEALRDSILSAPLDRSRPLWQVFLIPRLEDGRVGMVGKIHHSLVDGFAALQIVALVLDADEDEQVDPDPEATADVPELSRPTGPQGTVAWAADALLRTAADGLGVARQTAQAALRPRASVTGAIEEIGRVAQAVREDLLPPSPPSALNASIGARRTLVGYRAPRQQLREARSRGGTLNDVGLAVVTGALRELSLRRGEPPVAPLKTMIPVSMRKADQTEAGNKISFVYIGLPVHLDSPQERLDEVRAQTRRIKSTGRRFGTQTVFKAAGLLPAPLRSPVVKALGSQRVFNLTVSQSPAPRGPLHLMGCELEEPYSVVPISQGHALAIGMVRYNQELFFGCYADPDALPEARDLPGLLQAELRVLGGDPAEDRADEPSALENGRDPALVF
jgi:diacylglycerol O-acyltransferase